MKKQGKIIVLGPSLKLVGGVSNYYNALKLHEENDILYFEVNTDKKETIVLKSIRLLANYLRFIVIISKGNLKLVHINPSLDSKSFWRDSLFVFISRIFSKKIIVFLRGWEDTYEKKINENRLLKFVFNIAFKKADAFIVLGEIFKNKLIRIGINPDKPFFLETTVADSKYLNEFNLIHKFKTFDSEVKVLFISRIEKEKGIYIAMDACNLFYIKHPEIKLKLIVAGLGKELVNAQLYAKEKKLIMVDFVGQVKGDEKGKLLNECHIMLFPTYYGEGMPNSILEGMLYGMPVISRINAGIPDVVTNELNGYLTDSMQAEEFMKYLSKFVIEKDAYMRVAEANHNKAINTFTTEKVRERILKIYKNTLEKSS